MDIHHETLVFERDFDAPAERLFQAYSDPRQRENWSAPSPETMFVIDQTDVRTGGRETARCGSADNLNWTMLAQYHLVVENRLICFTEELWEGDDLLTVALITFEIVSRGAGGSRLKLTDQITSFVGAGGGAGHKEGYEQSLDHLAASLALN